MQEEMITSILRLSLFDKRVVKQQPHCGFHDTRKQTFFFIFPTTTVSAGLPDALSRWLVLGVC